MEDFIPKDVSITHIADIAFQHEALLGQSADQTWVFRGEGFRKASTSARLAPSLERAVVRFEPRENIPDIEYWLLREFQRRHHHYDPSTPHLWDTLEWLALMQHHGAPTRLLDWTYSPFIAAFFALQDAKDDNDAVIWCCRVDWLRKRALELLRNANQSLPDVEDPFRQDGTQNTAKLFDDIFCLQRESPPRPKAQFVYPANSFRLNPRLTIQQGVFLAPSDVSVPFHVNLSAMNPTDEVFKRWVVTKGSDGGIYRTMLRGLARMNLTEAVLYPGLDGFSRSLKLNWRLIGR